MEEVVAAPSHREANLGGDGRAARGRAQRIVVADFQNAFADGGRTAVIAVPAQDLPVGRSSGIPAQGQSTGPADVAAEIRTAARVGHIE